MRTHGIIALFTKSMRLSMLFIVSVLSGNGIPRVLVVAKEALFIEGVCALLGNYGACEVVGSAASAEEALERTRELRPDVVLIDTVIPTIDSEHLILTIRKVMGNVHVLLIGQDAHGEPIFRGLKAGAKGYISRTESASVLVSALLDIYHGEYFLSPSAAKMLVAEYRRIIIGAKDDPYHQLTDREREVLRHIAEGHSSRVIANELHISIKTAMGHRTKIMRKLDIHNTVGLIKYALSKHLAELQN